MEKAFKILSLLGIILLMTYCKNDKLTREDESRNTNSIQTINEIDQYVNQLRDRHKIPGISLAIIKDGKIVHKQHYGNANVEHNVPITDKSIFRVYSLTKPIVATGLFQLIEQNKVSLEDNVSKYVEDLPESWKQVKIKHLLTQSSGLPDIAKYQNLSEENAKKKVFDDPIHFENGVQYEYNQTNFWLIQKVIEVVSGLKVEDYIIKNQFSTEEKYNKAFFSTDSKDIFLNRVTAYFPQGKGRMQIDNSARDRYLTSANGLNITLDEFINWDRKLSNDNLINNETKEKMWSLFPYANSDRRFSYGWSSKVLNNHVSHGFSGSMITAYRNFPDDKLSIIFLSNGFEYWYNVERTINHLASLVDKDIIDIKNFIYQSLLKESTGIDFQVFNELKSELKSKEIYKDVDFQQQVNNVGYMHLNNLKNINGAIEIFELNKKDYPESWNVYDSLGEAYEKNKSFSKAIENYEMAIKLNSKNLNDYNSRLEERIKKLSQ